VKGKVGIDDANVGHKIPFDFAQGGLSTSNIIVFAMIFSGRDGESEYSHSSESGLTRLTDCCSA
jgi:hypothetical protein